MCVCVCVCVCVLANTHATAQTMYMHIPCYKIDLVNGLSLANQHGVVRVVLQVEGHGELLAVLGRPRREHAVLVYEALLDLELAGQHVAHGPVVEGAVDHQQVRVFVRSDGRRADAVLRLQRHLAERRARACNTRSLVTGRKQGRKEGRKQGRKQGRKEGRTF